MANSPEFEFLSDSIVKIGDFAAELSKSAIRAGINLPNTDNETRQEIAAQAMVVLNSIDIRKLAKALAKAGMMSSVNLVPLPTPNQKR